MTYRQLFGVGPTGIMGTVLIWMLALQADRWLGIPHVAMSATFRWILFGLFALDGSITVVWTLISLPLRERGKALVMTGPYRLVRHPLYSAVIWDGSGMMVAWFQSWALIFAIVLVNLFWAWHIQKEEQYMVEKFGQEYRKYMQVTGQFFPRFRNKGVP